MTTVELNRKIDSTRSNLWRVEINGDVFEAVYSTAADAVFGAMRKRDFAYGHGVMRASPETLVGVNEIRILVTLIPHRELVERAMRKRGETTTALAKKHARMLAQFGILR